MARKKKKGGGGGGGDGWLVTFSDLMTLLLTFFVLLLSMSTMDNSIITEVISIFQADLGFVGQKSAGQVPTRFKILQKLIEKPLEVLEKEHRIKDLLFPDEVLPKELEKSTLDENLKILMRNEGVAFVLTDALLFPSGGSQLNDTAKKVLEQFFLLLAGLPVPVNIAGYSDNIPSRRISNYQLSGDRAWSVLQYFITQGLESKRFSISGYGPNFPIADNKTEKGRAQNRRVEILVKSLHRTYM